MSKIGPLSNPSRRAFMAALGSFALAPTSWPGLPWLFPAQLRLLQGGLSGGAGHYLAGLEITLAPGFKTYWRHPGDTGVPPQFDFTASQNVKRAEVHFPAPIRFADGAGGHSFGYAGPTVVLPVTIEAADPTRPVVLRLKADYAVCEKICIPMSAAIDAEIALKPDGPALPALQRALSRVPVKTGLGRRNGWPSWRSSAARRHRPSLRVSPGCRQPLISS